METLLFIFQYGRKEVKADVAKRTKVEKATAISNARIQFVSLVDKAANQRTFLIKKEKEGKVTFSNYGRIVKTDSENHYVTGVVYEPMTEDSHGDYMEEAEIIKAAYYFAKNGDKVDLQHSFEPLDGATVVENWVAKADFKIDDEKIRKGTWLMTVEVTDADIWDKIEKGEISGFSMGGVGEYSEEDVDLSGLEKAAAEKADKKGLLAKLATVLGFDLVEKGAVAELFAERSKGNLFWEAFYSLQDTLQHYDPYTGCWQYEADEGKVRECLEDFNTIITDILTGKESITKAIQTGQPEQIVKAGKKMSGKNKETLNGIYESLGTFLKEFDDPEELEDGPDKKEEEEKEDKEVTKQEVERIVASAIEKAMGSNAQQAAGQQPPQQAAQDGAGAVVKAGSKESTTTEEITQESVEKMVQAAIAKATEPLQQEGVTAEQVQEMITAAVAKAVEPVLRSKGLPSNLNGSNVEKAAGEEHYLHGIL